MDDAVSMFIGSLVLAIVFGGVMLRRGWLWDRRGPGGRSGAVGVGVGGGAGGTGGGVRDLDGVPALILLVAGMLVLLASMFGASLVSTLGPARIGAPGSAQRGALMQAGAYPLAIAVGLAVLGIVGRRVGSRERAGLCFRWADVPRGVLAMVLVAPFYLLASDAAQFVYRAMYGVSPSPIQHEALRTLSQGHADGWVWAMIAGAVIGAPIVEELTFRVFVQGAVLRLLTGAGRGERSGNSPSASAWIAAATVSGVWTATHLGAASPVALPGLFVLGVGLGLAYERTRRLGVPIVMHVVFNAANIVMSMAGWGG